MAFVPLFCQSNFSPQAVCSPAELVRRARSLGYGSIGLCDEATMAGFHQFDAACSEQGLRPVFGCRLSLPGLVLTEEAFALDFLIEAEQGYRHLVSLLTEYHRFPSAGRPTMRQARLKGRLSGLRVIVPPEGELIRLLREQDREKVEKFLAKAVETFGAEFALGVGIPGENDEPGAMVRRLAEFVQVPAIAAPTVLYAEPTDEAPQAFLKNPGGPESRGWRVASDPLLLPALAPEEAIVERFAEGDESVHESGELARQCRWQPGVNRRIIPAQDFERGFDANSYLFDLVIQGATRQFGEIDNELKRRINHEFEEVKTNDLSTYLLLYHQVTQYLDSRGISRGVGRGSVVASTLAYCLGITRINPLEYRLAPQPIAPEGETFPPMRLEIPSSASEELIAWLRETFGEDHVAQIGRRLELKREHLIGDLAAWAGMTDDEKRTAVQERGRGRAASETRHLQSAAQTKKQRRWRDPGLISDMALRLSPRPRPLTAAPGRWTLCAEPLEYIIPTIEQEGGLRLTDIGEAAIDQLGGPRLELVAHHLLNLLDYARLAAAESVPNFSLGSIPLDDRATLELLGKGDTVGIPPLQGITVKCLLRRDEASSIVKLLKVRTEATRGRTAERDPALTEELPNVLLSYQCAYFKANHPDAYFAGALSSACENGDDISVLIRAAKRADIEILVPDINVSNSFCTVHGGKIRLGLRMVKRLGVKAWEEIARVRQGGRFHTLREFCEGVSPRVINHRLLQNLIAAGAFDDLGQTRAEMSEMVTELQRRSRTSSVKNDPDDQYTLFDLTSLETETPIEEEDEDRPRPVWDEATRRAREKEALGVNLDVDPIERYASIIRSLKPITADQLTRRMVGKVVRVAGLIDHVDVEGPLIAQPGAMLVDLEGIPVFLTPNLAAVSYDLMHKGAETLAIGEVLNADGYLRIDAHGVWRLADLEAQADKVAAIQVDLAGQDKSMLRFLSVLAQMYPGKTPFDPVGYETPRGLAYRALLRRRIFFCSPFYQALCKILAPEKVKLLDYEGQELTIEISSKAAAPRAEVKESAPATVS